MISQGFVAILYCLVLLPAIYLLGSFFQKWIREEDDILRGIFYVAFGLGALSYFIVLMGSFKALTLWPIVAFLAIVFLLRYHHLPAFANWIIAVFRYLKWPETGVFLRVTLGVFFASIIATIFLTFLPEIAHDSLCYHLNMPKLFVANASCMPMKYDIKSYQSVFMECLYTLGIFLRSVPTAKLFHWLTGFLLVLSVMLVIEKRTGKRSLAVFMGTMLWLTPTLFNQVAMTYNDAAVALYVWLSFLLFARFLSSSTDSSASSSLTDCFLSGILMGFATSCKFLALTVALPMGLFALFGVVCGSSRARWRTFQGLALFCMGVVIAGGYWFVRNYVLEGSPIYPLFSNKFGDGGIYSKLYSVGNAYETVFSYIFLPFLLVFFPDSFERSAWVGPFFLLLCPFFLITVWQHRGRMNALVTFVLLVSLFVWFQLAQNVRFLLPLFPIFLMVASDGVFDFQKFSPFYKKMKKGFGISALILLFFTAGVGIYHYRVHFQALGQRWSESLFLRNLERTYPAADWINKHLPHNARIFAATEYRHFYFDRPIIDVSYYCWAERIFGKLSPAELLGRLQKLGISHILRVVRSRSDGLPIKTDEPIYTAIDGLVADHTMAKLVGEVSSQNIREPRFDYQIFELLEKERNDNATN
jgi:hypothetical protein